MAVENGLGIPYHFPQAISAYFRRNCGGPAIYRWIIFKEVVTDLRRVYIGEAELLPRRIYGYLNPGPSQHTNQRLKAELEKELSNGHKVALEALSFNPFHIDDISISMSDLNDKAVRHFLEDLFTMYYSKLGYTVLNI